MRTDVFLENDTCANLPGQETTDGLVTCCRVEERPADWIVLRADVTLFNMILIK